MTADLGSHGGAAPTGDVIHHAEQDILASVPVRRAQNEPKALEVAQDSVALVTVSEEVAHEATKRTQRFG